jgi:hypothetical protein
MIILLFCHAFWVEATVQKSQALVLFMGTSEHCFFMYTEVRQHSMYFPNILDLLRKVNFFLCSMVNLKNNSLPLFENFITSATWLLYRFGDLVMLTWPFSMYLIHDPPSRWDPRYILGSLRDGAESNIDFLFHCSINRRKQAFLFRFQISWVQWNS